jgi:hypothetical protein
MSTDLLGGYRLLGGLVQLLNGLLVEAQVLLATYEDDGQALAEVQDLGDPLREGVSRLPVQARATCDVPSPVRCRASRASRWQSR